MNLSIRRFRSAALLLVLLGQFHGVLRAAAPSPPAAAKIPPPDVEARAFVQDILAQKPAKEFSISGVFHIRHENGRRTQIPVKYSVKLQADGWQSIYRTEPARGSSSEQLIVTHRTSEPNQYRLTQITPDGSSTNSVILSGGGADAVPFASSDFWLSDLGMEFLHWPEQRLVRDAKITMRWGRPLKVLESINPRPKAGLYSRVVSWIDSELGSLVRAEAYDLGGKRFKIFELKSFDKVNGRWEVKEMEIRNDESDTRTRLEFHFQAEAPSR